MPDLKFTPHQHREYFIAMRRGASEWIDDVFSGNTEFFAAHYWDLLNEMWYTEKPVMVSDALRFMRSIKSPYTARKYLQKMIDEKYVLERRNPNDDRSVLVELAPETKKSMDRHFDKSISRLYEAASSIKAKG